MKKIQLARTSSTHSEQAQAMRSRGAGETAHYITCYGDTTFCIATSDCMDTAPVYCYTVSGCETMAGGGCDTSQAGCV